MCKRLETSAKGQTFLPFFFLPSFLILFCFIRNNFILTKDQKAKRAKKKEEVEVGREEEPTEFGFVCWCARYRA